MVSLLCDFRYTHGSCYFYFFPQIKATVLIHTKQKEKQRYEINRLQNEVNKLKQENLNQCSRHTCQAHDKKLIENEKQKDEIKRLQNEVNKLTQENLNQCSRQTCQAQDEKLNRVGGKTLLLFRSQLLYMYVYNISN